MPNSEMATLRDLAGQALYLARLRDQRHITESEYIDRLNELRLQHGLWPIRPIVSKPKHTWRARRTYAS